VFWIFEAGRKMTGIPVINELCKTGGGGCAGIAEKAEKTIKSYEAA
jgi:hypothetical protein